MKIQLFSLFFTLLVSVSLCSIAPAQDIREDDSQALQILNRHPSWYNFYSPERSPRILFEFSGAVDAAAAAERCSFVSRDGLRVPAAVDFADEGDFPSGWKPAVLPEESPATDLIFPRPNALVVTPEEPLPVGRDWNLIVEEGIPAAVGEEAATTEAQRIQIGTINHLSVGGIEPQTRYDAPLRLVIRFNKPLHEDLEESDLADWIEVTPRPEEMAMKREGKSVLVDGDFHYARSYHVEVKGGLPAADDTILPQSSRANCIFEPRPPLLSLPAFDAVRQLGGAGDFEIDTANLREIRLRAKVLEGDNLVYALRAYELYSSDSDESSDGASSAGVKVVPYDTVAGRTVHSETIQLTGNLDQSERLKFDWNTLLGHAGPGALFIEVEGVPRKDVQKKGSLVAQSLIQITDIGLALKTGRDETVVFAFSQETGFPLSGVTLTMLDRENTPLQRVKTGRDGVARADAHEKAHWILAQSPYDRFAVACGPDERGLSLWRYGIPVDLGRRGSSTRRTALFTERPLYQPGETMHLKAVTRVIDDAGVRAGDAVPVRLKLEDPRNRIVLDRELVFGDRGSLEDAIVLPQQQVGWFRLMLEFPESAEGVDEYWERHVEHYFRVDEYRTNTFEVHLDSGELAGATMELPVALRANYYMGKPLSKAEYSWSATVRPAHFQPENFPDYHFGWWSYDDDDDGHFTRNGRGVFDESGDASIVIDISAGANRPGPRDLLLSAEVTDINQQTISAGKSIALQGSDYYLGIRRVNSVLQEGNPVTIEAVAVSPDGEPVPADVPVTCVIERREWNTIRMKTAGGGSVTRNEAVWIREREEALLVRASRDERGAAGHVTTFTPQKAGEYVVTLNAKDSRDRTVATRMRIYVHGAGAGAGAFARHDGVRIDLEPDKEFYRPGETARIAVKSPIAGTALITLERQEVRRHFLRRIEQGGSVLEIPIEESGPNTFLSALVVRGAAHCPRKIREPEYKLGFCELRVDDESKHLVIDFKPVAESFQPGETVAITGTVRNALGHPDEDAEITLFAVDEGVLSLTGFQVPDLFGVFHAPLPLSVKSDVTLEGLLSGDSKRLRFGNKGRLVGGGGDEELGNGGRLRKDFRACAFWSGSLRTDAEGRFRAEFEAPDSLTEYRVIAIACGGSDRFGNAESAFRIHKPLMIEPALARFGNLGDRIIAKGIVHNTTSAGGLFKVTLTLDETAAFFDPHGVVVEHEAAGGNVIQSKAIALAAGETGAVAFPVTFLQAGAAEWTWEVRPAPNETGQLESALESLSDSRVSSIEVNDPMPVLKESYYARLKADELGRNLLETIDRELLEGEGNVTVTLSRSRLLEASDALDYILHYPYGCVEQTTSSLMPWMRLTEFRGLLPSLRKTDDEINAAIAAGVERLLSMQTSSGGLSYWPGSPEPMLWGSAYGGLGLVLAKKQGAQVPDENLDQLCEYLSAALREVSTEKSPDRIVDVCLAAYTLAMAGSPEHAYHELLYSKRTDLPSVARSLLALAILEAGDDPAMAQALLRQKDSADREWRYWLGGAQRQAVDLMAWIRLNPDGIEADEAANELFKLRNPSGEWGCTYSNAWAVMALGRLAEQDAREANPIACDLQWGTDRRSLAQGDGWKETSIALPLHDGNRDAPLHLETRGDGSLVVHLKVESRLSEFPEHGRDKGFQLTRKYFEVAQDGSLSPAEELEIGDLVLVRLAVETGEGARYMVIDDPLPSVLEAINPNFKSQAARAGTDDESSWRYWECDHRETRADRVVFFRNYLPQGGKFRLEYLARVASEGEVLAPPARIEEMYDPGRYGLSAPRHISVPASAEIKTGAVALVEGD